MSIITFWNDSKEQTGKTLASVAFATRAAIDRNSKVLLISTSIADSSMENCFFMKEKSKNLDFVNGKGNSIAVENGIEGLIKLITSNKLDPSIITDYTRVVFKGRLEVILGASGNKGDSLEANLEQLKKLEECYIDLIRTANQAYDLVVVDLDKMLTAKTKEEILKISDVNVFVLSQKMESINRYNELKHSNGNLLGIKCVPLIGKYTSRYKYNSKNISRYLQEKKEMDVLPFNLLFMEAADEAKVVDLFLKLRNVKDKTDENYIFMESIKNFTNNILKKLQEMQMRMRWKNVTNKYIINNSCYYICNSRISVLFE